MRRLKVMVVCGLWLPSVFVLALVTLAAHTDSRPRENRGWWRARRRMAPVRPQTEQGTTAVGQILLPGHLPDHAQAVREFLEGKRLFERETFGGNGRTCLTCHSRETGTVSPKDARIRFRTDRSDPLFVHDGSDDEDGDGFGDGLHVTRMLKDATVLMRIRLHPDVEVKHHPEIREVTVRRGIPTTLNTPALDPVLMVDGRQPDLQAQALRRDHGSRSGGANRETEGTGPDREVSAEGSVLQLTCACALRAHRPSSPGAAARPDGVRKARARLFRRFAAGLQVNPPNFKPGACAACHSGPLMNQTNQFLPAAVPPGTRFQSVLVSEFNAAGNPVINFVFRNQEHDMDPVGNQDGTPDGLIEVKRRGCRRTLPAVLPRRQRSRWARSRGAADRAHRTGQEGHRGLHEAVGLTSGVCDPLARVVPSPEVRRRSAGARRPASDRCRRSRLCPADRPAPPGRCP